ncbi:hypothetical protein LCGC14_1241280 [marine sediment metagenome]|uniref:UDP-glucose 6-dehydrogenase n=1 Tax=marine sediment metagenome TaxID=412755 RepID=A0A0F9L5R9_9ZZZZ
MTNTCSIIGLGILGASMAAAMASRGFDVIGVDINKRSVDLLNEGRAPVSETDIDKFITKNKDRLRATMSHEEAILNSDVSFVSVPTPSDDRGAFSLQYVAWAFTKIGKALTKKDSYHNVVLTSTVLPGSTRYGLLPILEKESGKKCGADFGLCYSPEFIALGSVIRDFLKPDFHLIGQYDEKSGRMLKDLYSKVVLNNPPCKRMTIENAELTKIALNTFLTTKITFANMLSMLCQMIPGGDVDVVTDALGTDSRIGHQYLKGGLGYGGPCFPRDNRALSFIARELGAIVELAEITDQMNIQYPKKIISYLSSFLKPYQTVAILGLSYKPHTHVIEESQGIALARLLSKLGLRVLAFNPMVTEEPHEELYDDGIIMSSVSDCLKHADVVIIATPDPAFSELGPDDFRNTVTIIDFWRILDKEVRKAPNVRYIPIGKSINNDSNEARLKKLWETPKDHKV